MRTTGLKGIGAVCVMPIRSDGTLNEKEYARHLDWMIENGVSWMQPHAAAGQGPLTSEAEYERALDITLEVCKDRAGVTAYSGRVSTEATVAATKVAARKGVDCAFIIPPWYSVPDEESLYQHFKAVAEAVDLPLVAYNNPGRSGISMSMELVERLYNDFPNFVSLKQTDTTKIFSSYGRFSSRMEIGLQGDGEILLGLAMGSTWQISFVAPVMPDKISAIYKKWNGGDIEGARTLYYECYPMIAACGLAPSPAPLKYMLNRMGWDFGNPRMPVAPVTPAVAAKLDAVLKQYGLI